MKIPLSQLKNSLLSKAGGRAQANIPNFYSILQETAWMMMGKLDLPSSVRLEPFVNALYDRTGTIVLPDDFSLDGLIAIRPQDASLRTPVNTFINSNQWNAEQLLYTSTINIQNGIQTLNSKFTLPVPTVIDTLTSLLTGVWSAVGATSDIRVDSQYYISGGASIAFTAGAGNVNGVQLLLTTPVSIANLENVLVWVELPSDMSSVRISAGTDASNFYYQTLTGTYFNQPLKKGYNLLRLNLTNALKLGTPGSTVGFFKFEPLDTLDAPATFRLDSLVATDDAYVNLEYYSNSIFMNAAGQRINIPTSDSDFILLNEKEYPLFIRQYAEIVNTDVRPTGAATQLAVYGGTRLENLYEDFRQQYPSRRIWQADDYSSGRTGLFFGH